MTEDQEKLLAVFEVRVHELIGICERQKQKISELINSLESKDRELQQAMQTIEELKARCDSMLTARIVSINEKEVKSAKMRLSKLVREVDLCIALLNE
jgi:ABC-type phosphate transport system auxiliary subunit